MCNENEFLFNSDYLNRFFPKDSDGYNISQLVYYFVFFFPDGYKSEYRNKVIAVSEEYWSLCGSELKWMTDPYSLHWKKIPGDYDFAKWRSAYPEGDWCWQMIFHSGRVKYESPQYCIDGLGNSTQTYNTSHLYLCVPVIWFSDHPEKHPIQIYLRWAEMLKARHGTSGIGVFPAYDMTKRGQSAILTRTLSRYFPGIEICDCSQAISAGSGILSPNWLNLLDDEYLKALGGYDNVLKNLQGSNARIYKYDGGVIISASEHPQLCGNGEPLTVPEDYRIISRMLKPIRSEQLFGFWGVDTGHSLEWRERMD
ncbi:DUF3396 domain-containing protein [Salmonella enterica]|nr:DUF3396 domain-containing protein [Salmonella enterica]